MSRGIYGNTYSPGHPDLYREHHRLQSKMNDPNLSDREFARYQKSYQNLSHALYQQGLKSAQDVYGSPGVGYKGKLGPGMNHSRKTYNSLHSRYNKELGQRNQYMKSAQKKRADALSRRKQASAADKRKQQQLAAQKALEARRARTQAMQQQGRAIGDFINFGGGGMSSMPSQNFYRPYRPPAPRNDKPSARQQSRRESQPRALPPGSSLFQQAMLRGFSPPTQNPSRAVRQRSPRMSAAGRRQRSGDVNSPAAYFNNRFQRTDFPSYSRRGGGY